MVTIERTLNDVLSQLQRKVVDERVTYQGKIQFVDYSTRHIVVKVKGFGTIKRVSVQRGIQLGTTDRPVIMYGDVATVFQKPSGRWVCSSVTHKDHCATSPLPGEVIVDTSNEYLSSNSIITQQLASLDLPLEDLRFPPIEALGQLTLTDFRFPDVSTFLCGLPPCTDCGTPTIGMAAIITSDLDHPLCWKWSFREAPCAVYFKSQGAIKTFGPTETAFGDVAVVVREHYAYIALRGTFVFGFPPTLGDSHLLTYDLANPSSPVLVDTQVLTSPAGTQLAAVNIGVVTDTLWVSGFQLDGVTSNVDLPRTMKRFDISTRASPSLVGEWSTRLYPTWRPFLHYDTVTQTFTGQPYLVGHNWTNAVNEFDPFIVEDGLVGGEVGTLSGSYGNDTIVPVVCDNVVLVKRGGNQIRAIDLNNVAAPATLWEDTAMDKPEVYMGGNVAYARKQFVGNSRYTQVNVDATKVTVTGFPSSSDMPWGYYVNSNCLHVTRNDSNSRVYDTANQDALTLEDSASATQSGVVANGDAQFSSSDMDGATLFICHVGVKTITGTSYILLNVFTNRDI